jgi:hypothetical protein
MPTKTVSRSSEMRKMDSKSKRDVTRNVTRASCVRDSGEKYYGFWLK